jgi:hypothetical protein
MRYCILSIPRTGSTWLQNGIGHCFSRLKNYINLNEFFTPFVNNNHYTLDDNKMICHQKEITDNVEIDDVNKFNKFRMDFILNGNIKQPLIVKYMYWPYEGSINSEYSVLDNLKKIQNHNIKIININRNVFESAISYCVAKTTGIVHKYESGTGSWYHTNNGRLDKIIQSPVEIDNKDFEFIYMGFIGAARYKQKMADELNCPNINYNTLRIDCFNNKIPFQYISHTKKLYNEDYSSIIANYSQLIETKEKVEKMMNFLDPIGTTKYE